MDGMTFIAEMTKALAWPAAVIVVSLVFKRPVGHLVEGMRLRRITKSDWSADFEAATNEVRAELPSPAKNATKPAVSGLLNKETEHLVEDAPATAISQGWSQLEDRVAAVAAQAGVTQKLLPEVLRALVEKGMIQPTVTDAILGLRNMRNLAVHARHQSA